jgi:predicted RNA binding protein YcfA (HicA-like mRNA interferase family)
MGVKGKDLVKYLEQNGWRLKRVRGSHHVLVHEGAGKSITVAVHGGDDLPKGTLAAILKQVGLPDPRRAKRKEGR